MERSAFISVDFGCIIMKNLTDLVCTVISTRMKQPKLVETRHLMHDRRLWSVFRNSKLNKLFWHPCKTYEYRKAISPILSASSIDTEFCQSNFDGAKKNLTTVMRPLIAFHLVTTWCVSNLAPSLLPRVEKVTSIENSESFTGQNCM